MLIEKIDFDLINKLIETFLILEEFDFFVLVCLSFERRSIK